MITLVRNWRLLYQRRSALLLCCPIFFGFVVFFLSGGHGSIHAGLFLWLAAMAGALSAIVWKEAMGKPHAFCLPKQKYETGAVSVISAILLLFMLCSIWFGIRLSAGGVNAFTEASALFSYGCVVFLIGTWIAYQFSTAVVYNLFYMPLFLAPYILSYFPSLRFGAIGSLLFSSPLVSIPVGMLAAIGLSVYTCTQTGRSDQRRKLFFSADPGLVMFDFTKAEQINRIKERKSAGKAPQASVELSRERREAFFLERMNRAHLKPLQQFLWGYLYRWIGNPKVLNFSTFARVSISFLIFCAIVAWSGRNGETEGMTASLLPAILIVMLGAVSPLPLLRPMTLLAGRSERLIMVMHLFVVYTLMSVGLLLVWEILAFGMGSLLAQFSSLAFNFQAPTLGWTVLTGPLVILPLVFLGRLSFLRLGRAWVFIAFFIGVGLLPLLLLLPPVYQAGLSIFMWIWCIGQYRQHFQQSPLASPDGDKFLQLTFRA